MSTETVNFVLPIVRTRKGQLEPGQMTTFKKPEQAQRHAEKLAQYQPGVLTFTRTGDPDYNEYSEPVVTGRYGNVPDAIIERLIPVTF